MTPLRRRMIEDMQLRNFSIHTQKAYALHVAAFARHFERSPDRLGPDEIRTYQLYLRARKQLAPASVIQATAALRFLYTVTLKKRLAIGASSADPKAAQELAGGLKPG
jgi:integrase/recombinase XerD